MKNRMGKNYGIKDRKQALERLEYLNEICKETNNLTIAEQLELYFCKNYLMHGPPPNAKALKKLVKLTKRYAEREFPDEVPATASPSRASKKAKNLKANKPSRATPERTTTAGRAIQGRRFRSVAASK